MQDREVGNVSGSCRHLVNRVQAPGFDSVLAERRIISGVSGVASDSCTEMDAAVSEGGELC